MAHSTKKVMRQPCRISHLSGRVENNQTSTRAVGKGRSATTTVWGSDDDDDDDDEDYESLMLGLGGAELRGGGAAQPGCGDWNGSPRHQSTCFSAFTVAARRVISMQSHVRKKRVAFLL